MYDVIKIRYNDRGHHCPFSHRIEAVTSDFGIQHYSASPRQPLRHRVGSSLKNLSTKNQSGKIIKFIRKSFATTDNFNPKNMQKLMLTFNII